MGIILAAMGLLITSITYAAKPGGYFVVLYGAVLVGGFQAITGLFQVIGYKLKSPEGKAKTQAQASVTAVLQAMLATSIADGEINDAEVQAVSIIYKKLFGGVVEGAWIRQTATDMLRNRFDVEEAISDKRTLIDPEIRPMVLKAACLVATADDKVNKKESATLGAIAVALQMSRAESSRVFDEVRRTLT
ncbi:MAG TPA: TerB family tellurite resistance protein [Terriglobales bacterium]|nr:TerB family tellurite resistance protein [Terriglobales bacterium]